METKEKQKLNLFLQLHQVIITNTFCTFIHFILSIISSHWFSHPLIDDTLTYVHFLDLLYRNGSVAFWNPIGLLKNLHLY